MPKVVGIDPITGAPIVEEVGSSFEVSPTSISPANPPADAIRPVSEAKPLVGMDNRIEEAKRFNSQLGKPVIQSAAQVEIEQQVNKDVELRFILKRYGMDSQQQEKAFAEIKSLFT